MINGRPIDYTDLDYESLRAAMLGLARDLLPEWTDLSENDPGVVLIELLAYAADITIYYQNRIARNLLPATSDEPKALAQLLRLIGYELRPPTPATVNLTVGFDAPTPTPTPTSITVPKRTAFIATAGGSQIPFETVADLTIPSSQLTPPDAASQCFYFPVPVIQGRTVPDDPGTLADGTPSQRYTLARTPVLADSVSVTVSEPAGATLWRAVQTLADSTAADRHFMVQYEPDGTATIVFGDGTNGMIPPRGNNVTPTTIKPTYRVGGGPQGNVPALSVFASTLPSVRSATNPVAAAGGADVEDADRARRFAPKLYRTQERAVTLADYVDLALQVPGVGKARASPRGWNDVVLNVAPTGRVAAPTDLLRRDVLSALESRRMATTRVVVADPVIVDVYIGAVVDAQPYFLQTDVANAVRAAVGTYLAFENVDFGMRIYLSKIYEVVQELPQVVGLTIAEFRAAVAGTAIPVANGVIELGPDQLPRPGYGPRILDLTIRGGVVAGTP